MNRFITTHRGVVTASQQALLLACLVAVGTAPVFAAPASNAFNPASAAIAAAGPANGADDFAPGRILVLPRPGLSPRNLAALLSVHGGKARRLGASNLHVVELLGNASPKKVMAALQTNPHLKFVELDRRVKASFVPNDPYLGSQWHLGKINAADAWSKSQGSGVTIAVLDSGVDASHPDLAPNLVPGFNFVDNNTDTSDVCGHGTAVAGTAAAASNNAIGVTGVAGKGAIMPVRIGFFDTISNSCYAYYSTIASGITYAADHGARIVNVSYGGVAGSAAIQSAAIYLRNKGGMTFISAGNNGSNDNPVAVPGIVVVSATDANDALAGWSSYGPGVALSAPGAGIWTTSRGGQYQQWSGTSFSSPLTAGVAALMMAANPSLDNLTIESLLYATAVDLGAAGRDMYYGYGRVNAGAAVTAAYARPVAADTQAPVAAISAPLANATVSGLVSVNASAIDNVGVARVELKVNGMVVAVDSAAPFGFSWDSTGAPNGMTTLIATAFDLAGNAGASTAVTVNVANASAIVAVAETWTTCASEGGVCSFSNTRAVRYGANNSYATVSATGSVGCNNVVFGDPMYGVAKSCQYSSISTGSAPPTPAPAIESWTYCGSEGASCTFTGTRAVLYGANGAFARKLISGATACTNAVFGDPAYGATKACYYSSITQ